MTSPFVQQYRRWFEYEKDSHARVIASLHSVPPAGRTTPEYARALSLLAHLAAARKLWLHRFGVAPEPPREFFPAGLRLEEVTARVAEAEAAWTNFLDRLDEAELARGFVYQALDGPWFRSTIGDILTQLFGHSWYHRGQVAVLVRAAGGEPAITDFVYWSREPVPPPAG